MKLAIAKIFSCPIFLPPYSDFHSDRPKFFAAFSAPPSPDSVKGQQGFTKIYPDDLKEAWSHGPIVCNAILLQLSAPNEVLIPSLRSP